MMFFILSSEVNFNECHAEYGSVKYYTFPNVTSEVIFFPPRIVIGNFILIMKIVLINL